MGDKIILGRGAAACRSKRFWRHSGAFGLLIFQAKRVKCRNLRPKLRAKNAVIAGIVERRANSQPIVGEIRPQLARAWHQAG
jgi:hypothetical protein